MSPNYRLDLEYDGSDFHGWQVQPGGTRTVQGELQRALATLCGASVRVVGAGRTDAGVHALGQVASFQLETAPELQRFLRALNGLLPPDVRAHRLQVVPDDFSARGSALWRRYRYHLLRRPSPIDRRFAHLLVWEVDAQAMAQAAACLIGEHDFTAFAARDSAGVSRFCRILGASIAADARRVCFEITANRFLHNMVRRLTGALVEVGRGRLEPETLSEILAAGDASRGGPCLPPTGLFLVEVRYPGDPEGLEAAGSAGRSSALAGKPTL